jgi:hypothetical protein
MTEAEWLSCSDPEPMLAFLQQTGRASEPKLRLFGCACVRRVWHLLTNRDSRQAVEVAERFADGLASADEMATVANTSLDANQTLWAAEADPAIAAASAAAAATAAPDPIIAAEVPWGDIYHGLGEIELGPQAALLRCIFGNPFRPPPPLPPSCRTPAVTSLATTIYENRDFTCLPEIANALAAAGCEEAEVLEHL